MLKIVNKCLKYSLARETPLDVSKASRQMETSKKTPPPQLLQHQQLVKLYLEFEATPSDPLSTIHQRFIKKKRIIGDRRLYMPHKREHLLRLDSMLRQIEEHKRYITYHEIPSLPPTFGERLALEIENPRMSYFAGLLKEDRWVVVIAMTAIILMALIEVNLCQLPRPIAPT